MRYFLSITALIFAFCTLNAQSKPNHYSNHQIERILEEKIKVENVHAAIDFFKSHPDLQISNQSLVNSTLSAVNDRDAESIVHDDDQAESEIHAAINPSDSNNIIVAAISQDPTNILAPLKVPVYYTDNFGTTWKTGNLVSNPEGGFALGGGDPVIAFDKSGKAYISWLLLALNADFDLTITLYMAESSNKGKTWTLAPEPVAQEITSIDLLLTGTGSGKFVDKQWMSVDKTTGVHEGNLYVSYTAIEQIDSVTSNYQILVKTKQKTAPNFDAAVVVHQNQYAIMQFSSIDVDATGQIHVLFFAGNDASDLALYHTVSSNGGTSFAPETKISGIHFPSIVSTTGTENPITGIDSSRLYPCPHLMCGKTPGTIYAAWTADGISAQTSGGYDIYFSKSTNNGQSWSTPITINAGSDPAAEQYYSAMTVNPNGTLCISYYDRTEDAGGTETHYKVAISTDEGATFLPSVNASTTASDFAFIGDQNAGFGIGEYTQIVSTSGYAIPVWADGRTNDGDIDLYAAFLPIGDPVSGVGEIGSITTTFSINGPNPNPVSGKANLSIDLQRPTDLIVKVFAADGKIVYAEESVSRMPAGIYARSFALPKGIFFCQVETEFGFKTKKIVVE
jgi:hypothetical protein